MYLLLFPRKEKASEVRRVVVTDVLAYSELMITALLEGRLSSPGEQECRVCTMQADIKDVDWPGHLSEHVWSKELVPSLLWRAIAVHARWDDVLAVVALWRLSDREVIGRPSPIMAVARMDWLQRDRLRRVMVRWLAEQLQMKLGEAAA